jgi:hypothetical protein
VAIIERPTACASSAKRKTRACSDRRAVPSRHNSELEQLWNRFRFCIASRTQAAHGGRLAEAKRSSQRTVNQPARPWATRLSSLRSLLESSRRTQRAHQRPAASSDGKCERKAMVLIWFARIIVIVFHQFVSDVPPLPGHPASRSTAAVSDVGTSSCLRDSFARYQPLATAAITWTSSIIAVGCDFAEELLREQMHEPASRERPGCRQGRLRDLQRPSSRLQSAVGVGQRSDGPRVRAYVRDVVWAFSTGAW